ncbi:Oidioi.mRNA.OKI2018_I69.PAR.g8727.t1.cds [Oikopleura dioica]|uniref:Oidioi.mRNA.OKI2018_I69.PAR.g8727.t1.cds n=1 Tax=Oikopleura dioica TaxID=34765 RepID=A0ABN7RHC8_OIKDI|nr:Oidioi.mRNA.OKI2018_I69.PAR.g8727.t1.cds [Oikopleura dioica]
MFSLLSILLAFSSARTIKNAQTVQLYSKSGKFLNLNRRGHVTPTSNNKELSSIFELKYNSNGVVIRQPLTGYYVTMSRSGKLRATNHQENAVAFHQESLGDKFFTFNLADNSDCKLTASNRSFRVRCSKKLPRNKLAFLSKTARLPTKLMETGVHF